MNPERGVVVWVTSASAAAAQEVAVAVAEALAARELRVELLHADRPGFGPIATPAALATTAGLLAAHGVHGVVARKNTHIPKTTEFDARYPRVSVRLPKHYMARISTLKTKTGMSFGAIITNCITHSLPALEVRHAVR